MSGFTPLWFLAGLVLGVVVAAGALNFMLRVAPPHRRRHPRHRPHRIAIAPRRTRAAKPRPSAIPPSSKARWRSSGSAKSWKASSRGAATKWSGPRAVPTRRSAASTAGASSSTGGRRTSAPRSAAIAEQEGRLKGRQEEIDALIREQQAKLERVAGLTTEDARREVLQKAEDEARAQAQALARDIKEQAKRDADKEARRIIAMAIQRLAAETTAETTVAAVPLPNDEMKGRIIGREGRNIRAFETATGVDVIIDDTPDTVVVSCFDPIRRETARRALEALITDGRIQPGRIEEIVAKKRKELETELVELGEAAAFEVGIHGLHPELIKLIGRMRYRTSYGQNIYEHSKEVAWLAGMMAAELKLDVALAKRGGLLHDVGKVLTHESEGTHVELGVEMARKYGEKDLVINCIQAHHDDVPARDRRVGAGAGGRRDQRRAARGPARGVRELRQAAHHARGDRQRVRRRRKDQRDPGRTRGARDRDARTDRRRAGGDAGRGHRQADRERAAVSGADPGRGDSRVPVGREWPGDGALSTGPRSAGRFAQEVAVEVGRLLATRQSHPGSR